MVDFLLTDFVSFDFQFSICNLDFAIFIHCSIPFYVLKLRVIYVLVCVHLYLSFAIS